MVEIPREVTTEVPLLNSLEELKNKLDTLRKVLDEVLRDNAVVLNVSQDVLVVLEDLLVSVAVGRHISRLNSLLYQFQLLDDVAGVLLGDYTLSDLLLDVLQQVLDVLVDLSIVVLIALGFVLESLTVKVLPGLVSLVGVQSSKVGLLHLLDDVLRKHVLLLLDVKVNVLQVLVDLLGLNTVVLNSIVRNVELIVRLVRLIDRFGSLDGSQS